jgi:hypothetical protein
VNVVPLEQARVVAIASVLVKIGQAGYSAKDANRRLRALTLTAGKRVD